MSLSPASSHGGSSSPVDSWLAAYLAAQLVDPPNAPAAFNSPPDGATGSDIAISVDGKTITFVTAGLYVIAIYVVINGAGFPDALTISPIFPVARGFFNTVDTQAVVDTNGGVAKAQLTYSPVMMEAGDTLSVYFNANGGTVTVQTASNLVVTKIA